MINKEAFLKMPKELFVPKYKELSVLAKVIYCFLLERYYLSRDNKWTDEKGEIYVYYTTKSLAELLDVSEVTVIKQYRLLETFGLIYRTKQGLGKPDKIKVKPLLPEEAPKKSKWGCSSMAAYDIKEIERLINAGH